MTKKEGACPRCLGEGVIGLPPIAGVTSNYVTCHICRGTGKVAPSGEGNPDIYPDKVSELSAEPKPSEVAPAEGVEGGESRHLKSLQMNAIRYSDELHEGDKELYIQLAEDRVTYGKLLRTFYRSEMAREIKALLDADYIRESSAINGGNDIYKFAIVRAKELIAKLTEVK